MPEESALDQLLKSGEFLHHLDMDRKTADLVFDRRTIKALYEFMSSQHIDYVDFPISAGKESVVFKVIKDKKPLVLKIYKLSTLRFSTIWKYIEGDYRFARERINKSNMIVRDFLLKEGYDFKMFTIYRSVPLDLSSLLKYILGGCLGIIITSSQEAEIILKDQPVVSAIMNTGTLR